MLKKIQKISIKSSSQISVTQAQQDNPAVNYLPPIDLDLSYCAERCPTQPILSNTLDFDLYVFAVTLSGPSQKIVEELKKQSGKLNAVRLSLAGRKHDLPQQAILDFIKNHRLVALDFSNMSLRASDIIPYLEELRLHSLKSLQVLNLSDNELYDREVGEKLTQVIQANPELSELYLNNNPLLLLSNPLVELASVLKKHTALKVISLVNIRILPTTPGLKEFAEILKHPDCPWEKLDLSNNILDDIDTNSCDLIAALKTNTTLRSLKIVCPSYAKSPIILEAIIAVLRTHNNTLIEFEMNFTSCKPERIATLLFLLAYNKKLLDLEEKKAANDFFTQSLARYIPRSNPLFVSKTTKYSLNNYFLSFLCKDERRKLVISTTDIEPSLKMQ